MDCARHEFFASTGLSENNYISLGRGDRGNLGQDFLKRRAVANDVSETGSKFTNVLGLRLLHAPGSQATLSATGEGLELLVLTEDMNARSRPPRSTGLYHFAIRYPGRQHLAHAYRWLVRSDYPVAGASDHGVSEALYLSDPDGNGVELCADRPRAQRPLRDGQIAMVTKALDLDDLLAVARPVQRRPKTLPCCKKKQYSG